MKTVFDKPASFDWRPTYTEIFDRHYFRILLYLPGGSTLQDGAKHPETVRGALIAATFNCVAWVEASDHAVDLAISLSDTRLIVVRCADQALPKDHSDLASMMAEGDFVWAGLVFGEREGSEAVGLVETFHVSELDGLVARLSALREAFDGAR